MTNEETVILKKATDNLRRCYEANRQQAGCTQGQTEGLNLSQHELNKLLYDAATAAAKAQRVKIEP